METAFQKVIFDNGEVAAGLTAFQGVCWSLRSNNHRGGFYYLPDDSRLAYFDPETIGSNSPILARRIIKSVNETVDLAYRVCLNLQDAYLGITGVTMVDFRDVFEHFLVYKDPVRDNGVLWLIEVDKVDPEAFALPADLIVKDPMWQIDTTGLTARTLWQRKITEISIPKNLAVTGPLTY